MPSGNGSTKGENGVFVTVRQQRKVLFFDVCHIPWDDPAHRPWSERGSFEDELLRVREQALAAFDALPKPGALHCSAGIDRSSPVAAYIYVQRSNRYQCRVLLFVPLSHRAALNAQHTVRRTVAAPQNRSTGLERYQNALGHQRYAPEAVRTTRTSGCLGY